MFVYVLFFIAIAAAFLVEGHSQDQIQKRRNIEETIIPVKAVTSELRTILDGKSDHESPESRKLTCSCGTFNPNASTENSGCCFVITDGCGSSASICCEKHTYCNCVTGDCGICIDLGINTRKSKGTYRYSKSVAAFQAIYAGRR